MCRNVESITPTTRVSECSSGIIIIILNTKHYVRFKLPPSFQLTQTTVATNIEKRFRATVLFFSPFVLKKRKNEGEKLADPATKGMSISKLVYNFVLPSGNACGFVGEPNTG